MAYTCILHLKAECDGCGLCEAPDARRIGMIGKTRRDPFRYDADIGLYEIEFDDER